MLLSLSVKNLALVEEAEIFFDEGLNILTGETGAGKSIILGSINLALGGVRKGVQATDVIRGGAGHALIELTFRITQAGLVAAIQAMGFFLEDDGLLILSRRIMPGRGSVKVNGETINATQLKNLAGLLLDIHGQHERGTLLKSANHRDILDAFGREALEGPKSELKRRLKQYNDIVRELEAEDKDAAARLREISLLEFEIKEIEGAAPVVGEDEQLEGDYRRMNSAVKIREALKKTHLLTGYDEAGSAGAGLGRALRELGTLTGLDAVLEGLGTQLGDIDALLADFNRTLANYLMSLEFDDAEFLATETRLNLLNHLKAKYADSLAGILEAADKKQKRVEKLRDFEKYCAQLAGQQAALRVEILDLCRDISQLRRQLATKLADSMRLALSDLNFPHASFEVSLISNENDFGAEGFDEVLFMISPNVGEEARSLHQIASGGELSRIMLALKTIKADREDVGTLIFDEIDAGISGKTAWKVAERLAVLAKGHQVICITHLAQIAAMADAHFMIKKDVVAGRTLTTIKALGNEAAVVELARLLGTQEISEAVLTNATEMKALAAEFKGEKV